MSEDAAVRDQVRRLQDLEEIKTLTHKYTYGANIIGGKPGDLNAFVKLFAEDATFDVGMGAATGHAEILEMMKALTTQWECAMHYMLNPVIELDGDRASGKITGLFAFTTKKDPAPIWLSNIYSDTFVRTADGWRFQSISLVTTFADPAFLVGYADHLE
ncbi:MAG: hypothetical protein GC201_12545 [Alphaproteobacteria bacterium]|nr:hypothetical protein [Alphaproteobacteria bacterium]